MKTSLIRIGNSKGLRLPKPILDQCGITDAVDLEVERDRVIIRPAKRPRFGWDDAFAEMAGAGDDGLLDEPSVLASDRNEWHW